MRESGPEAEYQPELVLRRWELTDCPGHLEGNVWDAVFEGREGRQCSSGQSVMCVWKVSTAASE